jgi:hypothetical protein
MQKLHRRRKELLSFKVIYIKCAISLLKLGFSLLKYPAMRQEIGKNCALKN